MQEKNLLTFKIPHVYSIIFTLLVITAIATWVLPAGEYDRVVTPEGQTIAVHGSYHQVKQNPANLLDFLSAPAKGFKNGGAIIGFLIIVGGVFGIINRTGSIDAGIKRAIKKISGKEILIVPIFMTLFSIGGAVFIGY